MSIDYIRDRASVQEILDHLSRCSEDFIPPLRERVKLPDYALKIVNGAVRFEAWSGMRLIGLVAMYRDAWFITSISVLPTWRGMWIAKKLVKQAIDYAEKSLADCVRLEVGHLNHAAIQLYGSLGFVSVRYIAEKQAVEMVKRFTGITVSGTTHFATTITAGATSGTTTHFENLTRDTPTARYAYSFDFDVMHPMMIRTFKPWFVGGDALELGSFEGAFTKRLTKYFEKITCVEASQEAAKKALYDREIDCSMTIMQAPFETVSLEGRQYDNIFMTHVLEHVANPVLVLKRVNDEWLAPGGRLFLACPNANAASRQIAVKMGLLSSTDAVTADEAAHGHKQTYDLEHLERDARLAGLKVITRGGIFFKALANFQLDKAKVAGIIDDAYLEGCYQLGQIYPDLCASIYLICEKGEAK